jgi:fibro-slime domain-containing protein
MWVCRDFSRTFPDMDNSFTGPDKGIVSDLLNPIDKKPVWKTPVSENEDGTRSSYHPSVTTKRNFDRWFRDVPGTNYRKEINLLGNPKDSATTTPSLQWTYGGNNFYPFDSKPPLHNYYFTCEHHGRFTYEKGAGQYVTYGTSDDGWLYLNGKLLVDLGGTHRLENGTVRLDALDFLVDGSPDNRLDLFFANRYPPDSALILTTNVCLFCNGRYDECGACVGKRTNESAADEGVDSTYVCDPSRPPFDSRGDPGEEGRRDEEKEAEAINEITSTEGKLSQKVNCHLVSHGSGLYEFGFRVELEYPYFQPNALVIGLSPYNSDVRKRGSCDNRDSDLRTAWSNRWDDGLWNPGKAKPNVTLEGSSSIVTWTVAEEEIEPPGRTPRRSTKVFLFSAVVGAESLLGCRDSRGFGRLVNHVKTASGAIREYYGSWIVTRTSPVDLEDESLGEVQYYQKTCNFKIEESSTATSAIVLESVDPGDRRSSFDSPAKVQVISGWTNVYCGNDTTTDSNTTTFLVLKTCAHVVSSDDLWAKLSFPGVSFEDDPSRDRVGIVELQSSLREDGGCGPNEGGDWLCCQRWLVSVDRTGGGDGEDENDTSSFSSSFEGSFYLAWSATIFDSKSKAAVSQTNVTARLIVNMSDVCEKGTISVEAKGEGPVGDFELHTDPEMTRPYKPPSVVSSPAATTNGTRNRGGGGQKRSVAADVENSSPLRHLAPVYAKLAPRIDEASCERYDISVRQVVMSYNGAEGVVRTVIYDRGGVGGPDSPHRSVVLNKPSGRCYSNITWILRKPNCTDGYAPSASAESPVLDDNGDEPASERTKEGDEGALDLIWNGKTESWSREKRATEASKIEKRVESGGAGGGGGAVCAVTIVIFWELSLKNDVQAILGREKRSDKIEASGFSVFSLLAGTERKDDIASRAARLEVAGKRRSTEDIEEDGDDDGDRDFRVRGFLHDAGAHVEIRCHEGHVWDVERGACVSNRWQDRFFGWDRDGDDFDDNDDAVFWVFLSIFIAIAAAMILLLLCAVCTDPVVHDKHGYVRWYDKPTTIYVVDDPDGKYREHPPYKEKGWRAAWKSAKNYWKGNGGEREAFNSTALSSASDYGRNGGGGGGTGPGGRGNNFDRPYLPPAGEGRGLISPTSDRLVDWNPV